MKNRKHGASAQKKATLVTTGKLVRIIKDSSAAAAVTGRRPMGCRENAVRARGPDAHDEQ